MNDNNLINFNLSNSSNASNSSETIFLHKPVMLNECINLMNIRPHGIYVDCTAGGGGHSHAICEHINDMGHLIAIDQDEEALIACRNHLEKFGSRVTYVKSNFSNIASVLSNLNIDAIDGALLDLGVSSYQFDNPERGFSYNNNAYLDMRMDGSANLTAHDVVNNYSESELQKIIFDYGEERFASRIAHKIVTTRDLDTIDTTVQLSDIIKSAIPSAARQNGPHPARRTFQAIRIEVNSELDVIEPTLRALKDKLRVGGRIAVITFHSLEDRIVKDTFNNMANGCICPRSFPVCVCDKKPEVIHISRKPIIPSLQEIDINPRSRSAKLRVVEKIDITV